jgi:hypothetical protein
MGTYHSPLMVRHVSTQQQLCCLTQEVQGAC